MNNKPNESLEPYFQAIAGLLCAGIIGFSIILSGNMFNTSNAAGTTNVPVLGSATANIDDDAILGNKDTATLAILEFSDYECPYCKKHFIDTHEQLKREYIDTGKAILIFRDFPLSIHDPLASKEAMATECVQELGGDSKFYEFHDLLFSNTTSNGTGLDQSQLTNFAKQIGINTDSFIECLETEKFKAEVQKDMADGQAAGVAGTPGFIVGKYDRNSGKVTGDIISGAVPFATFKAALDKYTP